MRRPRCPCSPASRASHGDRLFTIFEEERVSFEASFRATAALAAELQRRGVGKGDRVALAMVNLPEWPVAFFAITALGAIAVPLNAWWTGAGARIWPRRFGREALICDAARCAADRAASGRLCPTLEHVIVSRAGEPATGSRI